MEEPEHFMYREKDARDCLGLLSQAVRQYATNDRQPIPKTARTPATRQPKELVTIVKKYVTL